MKVFKDSTGKEWQVAITVATLKQTKSFLGLDMLALQDNNASGLADLVGNPEWLIDTLYVICRKQADDAGITDEQFGQRFDGYSTLVDAANAFLGAYTDFFFSPEHARKIQNVFDIAAKKQREAATNALDKALNALQKDGESSAPSGNSPDESESTQGRLRLVN